MSDDVVESRQPTIADDDGMDSGEMWFIARLHALHGQLHNLDVGARHLKEDIGLTVFMSVVFVAFRFMISDHTLDEIFLVIGIVFVCVLCFEWMLFARYQNIRSRLYRRINRVQLSFCEYLPSLL